MTAWLEAAAWRSRLWRKHVSVLVGTSMAIIGAYGAADMGSTYRASQRQAAQVLQAHAREAAYALRLSLASIHRSIEAVHALPLEQPWMGLSVRREEYGRLLLLVPAADSISHWNARGEEQLRVSRRGVHRLAGMSGPAAVSAARMPEADGGVVLFDDALHPTVRLKFEEQSSRGGGATTVDLSLLSWAAELLPVLAVSGINLYVVDPKGALALHADASEMLARKLLRVARAVPPVTAASASVVEPLAAIHAAGLAGGRVFRTLLEVPELNWTVVVERDHSEVLAPVFASLWRSVGFMAAGAVVAMLVSAVLAGRMTRPVRALHLAARRLGEGRPDVAVEINSGDELEDLSHQFNAMAAQLRANLQNLESQVAARTMELQRANRHKGEFLANMSHELRTPLNAVLGFADVLTEGMAGPLNDEQREYVNDIHASGLHLLALINDVLDLSKIEAGQMALQFEDFDAHALLQSAATLVRQRALRKGLQLVVDLPTELPVWHGDALRVKQVVLNLLSNAVKFTPGGGKVRLHAGMENDALRIVVSDTGVGITEADQTEVFEPFVQVGGDAAGRAEGSGLGLALVRQLVEQHRGTVRLDSHVGQGSTFTVVLPRLHGTVPAGVAAARQEQASDGQQPSAD